MNQPFEAKVPVMGNLIDEETTKLKILQSLDALLIIVHLFYLKTSLVEVIPNILEEHWFPFAIWAATLWVPKRPPSLLFGQTDNLQLLLLSKGKLEAFQGCNHVGKGQSENKTSSNRDLHPGGQSLEPKFGVRKVERSCHGVPHDLESRQFSQIRIQSLR